MAALSYAAATIASSSAPGVVFCFHFGDGPILFCSSDNHVVSVLNYHTHNNYPFYTPNCHSLRKGEFRDPRYLDKLNGQQRGGYCWHGTKFVSIVRIIPSCKYPQQHFHRTTSGIREVCKKIGFRRHGINRNVRQVATSSCKLNWPVCRNFCMKDWLEQNPNGLKDTFKEYFRALSADARKVSTATSCFLLLDSISPIDIQRLCYWSSTCLITSGSIYVTYWQRNTAESGSNCKLGRRKVCLLLCIVDCWELLIVLKDLTQSNLDQNDSSGNSHKNHRSHKHRAEQGGGMGRISINLLYRLTMEPNEIPVFRAININ